MANCQYKKTVSLEELAESVLTLSAFFIFEILNNQKTSNEA